ncbi:type II toxin-antitoxin system death-on-curing family toxin [Streptococcus uberis]|uniref:type II toxin-antitoxin system death-on-curing family toxin n=1 Tax=Streptococcus uberis TaxID=1349 RepID=UPI003D6BD30F
MTKYLTENQIIALNKRVIERYSIGEEIRLVSPSALNMIVNLPEQYLFGNQLYPTLVDKATILFVQLVKKHVFANGNKRTAFLVLNLFLNLNHVRLVVKKEEAIDFTVKVAVEPLTEETLSSYRDWLSEHIFQK